VRLGAHVSTAGGVSRAFANAAAISADALQIFVKNANRWHAKPLAETEVAAFHAARAAHGDPPVVAHASYLINLGATNPQTLARSRAALEDELARCAQLGVDGLVLHPGAHLGAGIDAGLDAVARSLDVVLAKTDGVQVWLENTAGQGTVLGSRAEELAAIIARSDQRERLGVCLDTCHAFAAGYPVHTGEGLEAFLETFGSSVGFERLGCWHLNDALYGLGSHRDRHANLGEGEIGLETFVTLACDPCFEAIPMILETPLGDDLLGHVHNLKRLRKAARL